MEYLNNFINEYIQKNSLDVNAFSNKDLINLFSVCTENWIFEQYSQTLQTWVIKEYSPTIQKYLTNEFLPALIKTLSSKVFINEFEKSLKGLKDFIDEEIMQEAKVNTLEILNSLADKLIGTEIESTKPMNDSAAVDTIFKIETNTFADEDMYKSTGEFDLATLDKDDIDILIEEGLLNVDGTKSDSYDYYMASNLYMISTKRESWLSLAGREYAYSKDRKEVNLIRMS